MEDSDVNLRGWNPANSVMEFVIIFIGFWKLTWELGVNRATRHLGPISTDEQKSGYFVAGHTVRGWRWWIQLLLPFATPYVPVPKIPRLSQIIRAGDNGAFASSMISCIIHDHYYVSWRPIYEAFFQEFIWAKDRMGDGPNLPDMQILGSDMKGWKYALAADVDVWKVKRMAERRGEVTWVSPFPPILELKHPPAQTDNEHLIARSL